MNTQNSLSLKYKFIPPQRNNSISLIPQEKEFDQCYIVYRVNLKSLEITQKTRDNILAGLSENKKYIQIDEMTIMLNSISSIEPLNKKDQAKKSVYDEMKQQFDMESNLSQDDKDYIDKIAESSN